MTLQKKSQFCKIFIALSENQILNLEGLNMDCCSSVMLRLNEFFLIERSLFGASLPDHIMACWLHPFLCYQISWNIKVSFHCCQYPRMSWNKINTVITLIRSMLAPISIHLFAHWCSRCNCDVAGCQFLYRICISLGMDERGQSYSQLSIVACHWKMVYCSPLP